MDSASLEHRLVTPVVLIVDCIKTHWFLFPYVNIIIDIVIRENATDSIFPPEPFRAPYLFQRKSKRNFIWKARNQDCHASCQWNAVGNDKLLPLTPIIFRISHATYKIQNHYMVELLLIRRKHFVTLHFLL